LAEAREQERKRLEELEQQRREAEAAQAAAREEAERARREAQEAEEAAEREAARKAQQEAERKAREQAAAAEKAREERLAGLLDQYKNSIKRRVQANWRQPSGFSDGDRAEVQVTQIPSGDVTDVRLLACSGGSAFCDSVVSAVRRASPLPQAPEPEVFERVLQFNFRPEAS